MLQEFLSGLMSTEYLAQAIADAHAPADNAIFLLSSDVDPYTPHATTAGRMLEVNGGLCTCSDVSGSLGLSALNEFTLTGKPAGYVRVRWL